MFVPKQTFVLLIILLATVVCGEDTVLPEADFASAFDAGVSTKQETRQEAISATLVQVQSQFESPEHVLVGSDCKWKNTKGQEMGCNEFLDKGIRGGAVKLSLGELVAMSGDLIYDADPMNIVSLDLKDQKYEQYIPAEERKLSLFSQRMKRFQRSYIDKLQLPGRNHKTGHYTDDWLRAMQRYVHIDCELLCVQVYMHILDGLNNNYDHFDSGRLVPGSREAYLAGHVQALHKAMTCQKAADPETCLQEAYATDGLALHFLTDHFAGGHNRTPIEQIAKTVGTYPTGAAGDITAYETYNKVGTQINTAIGNLGVAKYSWLVNAQHNEENVLGLRAKNQRGKEWILLGDHKILEHDNQETKNIHMVFAAVQASIDEVYDAYRNPSKWSSKVGSNKKEAGDKANEEANADGHHFPFGLAPSPFEALNWTPLPLDKFACKKTTASAACVPKQVQVSKAMMGSNKCFNVDCAGRTGASCDAAKDGGTSCCEQVKRYVSVGLNEQPNHERSCTTGKGSHNGKCSVDSDCFKWRGATKCVAGSCLCTGKFISLNGFCVMLPPHGPQIIRHATESVKVRRNGQSRMVKMSDLKVGDKLDGMPILSGGEARVTTPPSAHTTFQCTDMGKLNPPPLFIDGAQAGLSGTLLARHGDFLRGEGYQRYTGEYKLIDLSDSTYGMKMLEKTYKDNFVLSANPLFGFAGKIAPPSKSIKTRPAVWKQAAMSKEDQSEWKRLIGKQSSTQAYITGGGMKSTGLCERSTSLTCGGDSDCHPDPKNPCKGTCVCDPQGFNECKCLVPGYVGQNRIYKVAYDLKKHSGCAGWRQTGGCSASGTREPHNDKNCFTTVQNGWSGYCECTGGTKAMEKGCGAGAYATCAAACAASGNGEDNDEDTDNSDDEDHDEDDEDDDNEMRTTNDH